MPQGDSAARCEDNEGLPSGDPSNGRCQSFEALGHYLGIEQAYAGEIAARTVEAGDEADLNWVGAHRKNDGDRLGRCLGGERGRCAAMCDDQCHLMANQI